MFELEVPFLEKDTVKSLGARWNTATKKWFVPAGVDVNLFRNWWPAGTALATSQPLACSLLTLLTKIKTVINQNFPDREWVIAEISEITNHNGNYYLTLVEYDESGCKQAQINARIWRDKALSLMAKFQEATGSALTAGIKVLLLANINFHPQYGMAVTIDDLDPSYTIGDMLAKIKRIKETLQQEQIFTKNKQIPIPTEFTRIAVISPKQAAGLGDFSREADLLVKYQLCEFVYFTATFQGKTANLELIAAINQVLLAHQAQPFDAIVIIRGGGSVADLAWLNELELARAICLCPLAIMVGIGHKRDHTILDEVANSSFDTPSKVIANIFQVISHNAETALNDFFDSIKIAEQLLVTMANELATTMLYVRQEVFVTITTTSRELVTIWQLLVDNLQHKINSQEQELEALIREIICQGPDAVLTKGFAMASYLTGGVITSAKQAIKAKTFKLAFHDGSLLIKQVAESSGD